MERSILKTYFPEKIPRSTKLCPRPRGYCFKEAFIAVSATFLMFFVLVLSIPCVAEGNAEFQDVVIWQKVEENRLPSNVIASPVPLTRRSENSRGKTILSSPGNLHVICSAKDDDQGDVDLAVWPEEDEEIEMIADPLEPINRVFFQFNDKLYFWFLKPLATGYEKIVPRVIRIGIRDFFSNLSMPVRAVNCLLQGRVEDFGDEVARFFINSSVGMLGFMDPAKQALNIKKHDEDLGQTLGSLGFGPGLFINWPILGPSTLRDTIGSLGDSFLNPVNYSIDTTKYNLAVKGYEEVNETSLRLGDYESLKKAAIDPYISVREAYHQYRLNKIRE